MKFIFFLIVFVICFGCTSEVETASNFIKFVNNRNIEGLDETLTTNYISINSGDTLKKGDIFLELEKLNVNGIKFKIDSLQIQENSNIVLFLTENDYFSNYCDAISPLKQILVVECSGEKISKTIWKTMTASTNSKNKFIDDYLNWFKQYHSEKWILIDSLSLNYNHHNGLIIDSLINSKIYDYCR